jgi:hypothetical protein
MAAFSRNAAAALNDSSKLDIEFDLGIGEAASQFRWKQHGNIANPPAKGRNLDDCCIRLWPIASSRDKHCLGKASSTATLRYHADRL